MMTPLYRWLLAFVLIAAPLVTLGQAHPQGAEDMKAAVTQTKEALEAAEKALADGAEGASQEVVDQAQEAYDAAVETLKTKVAELKEQGEDVTELREFLVETTGDLTNLDLGSAAGLVEKWTVQGKDWLVENGPSLLVKFVMFLLILFVFRVLAGIAGSIMTKALSSSKLKVSDLLRSFFVNIVRKVVFLVGLMIALGQIGVDIGPLLAGVGVIGFVVGFALQDTLGHFAAGVMILLYRPYDVGDVITAGGETGKVDSMSLVSTTIVTPDNQVLVVPNGSIWGGTIRNVTARNTRRVDLVIGIGYGDDIDKAAEVIMDEITKHPLVLKDPEPVVKLHNLGESSVDFHVRPWSKTADYWDVYFDLTKLIKQRLDKEGISIPFPQRDIHIVSGGVAESA